MDLSIGRYSVKFIALSVGAQAKYAVSRAIPEINKKPDPVSGDKWNTLNNRFAEGKVYYNINMTLTDPETDKSIEIEDAVCKVNRAKSIVKTQLVGMEGTVKEYISMGDYDINIDFNIVSCDSQGNVIDEYPAEGVKMVEEIFSINNALEVKSDFLALLGITKLVISDLQISQQTYSNVQSVSISALSDEDFEITSKD